MQLAVVAVGLAVAAGSSLIVALLALLAGASSSTAATRGGTAFGAFAALTVVVVVVVSVLPGLTTLSEKPSLGANQVDFVLPATSDPEDDANDDVPKFELGAVDDLDNLDGLDEIEEIRKPSDL